MRTTARVENDAFASGISATPPTAAAFSWGRREEEDHAGGSEDERSRMHIEWNDNLPRVVPDEERDCVAVSNEE